MQNFKHTFFLLLLTVIYFSCNDVVLSEAIEAKTIIKHKDLLQTEYNPVFLSKRCDKSSTIKLFVPKPYPNNYGSIPYRKSGDSTHYVHIYLDSLKLSEIPLSDEFSVLKDSTEYRIGYKIIEFKMPSFSKTNRQSGILNLELFSNNEFITSYATKYRYIEDGEEVEVIKRIDVQSMEYAGPLDLKNYNNDFKLEKAGIYKDDLKCSHTIKKMKNHYLSSYSANGNKISYKKNTKDTWKDLMEIPNLPTLTSQIPLEFELEENTVAYEASMTSHIDFKNTGKSIIFDYYNKVIGNKLSIQYKDCELNIVKEEKISMPLHVRFNIKR